MNCAISEERWRVNSNNALMSKEEARFTWGGKSGFHGSTTRIWSCDGVKNTMRESTNQRPQPHHWSMVMWSINWMYKHPSKPER